MAKNRLHYDEDDSDEDMTIPLADIELSFTEELNFFLQFFCHLIVIYSRCYLGSLYRFLKRELSQHLVIVRPRQAPRIPQNRIVRNRQMAAPTVPLVAQPNSTATADGAATTRRPQTTQCSQSPVVVVSCPSVSSSTATTTTTTTTKTRLQSSPALLDLPSQQQLRQQQQQQTGAAAVLLDESIPSSTLVETFGLAFKLSFRV